MRPAGTDDTSGRSDMNAGGIDTSGCIGGGVHSPGAHPPCCDPRARDRVRGVSGGRSSRSSSRQAGTPDRAAACACSPTSRAARGGHGGSATFGDASAVISIRKRSKATRPRRPVPSRTSPSFTTGRSCGVAAHAISTEYLPSDAGAGTSRSVNDHVVLRLAGLRDGDPERGRGGTRRAVPDAPSISAAGSSSMQ